MQVKKLKGVCVGAGYFSQFHYDAWNRLEAVELLAVCDTDLLKAMEIAEKYNIPNVYSDVTEMLEKENPDFIDIITPPASHFAIAKIAAERGVHIICQKPLAPDIAQALEMQQYMAKQKVIFAVHENWRFQPWYRQIKIMLDQHVIGDQVFSMAFRMRMGDGWGQDAYLGRQPYFREMPRLLIHETGIHFVDTFRFLAGVVKSVYTKTKRLNNVIKGEDFALTVFDFDNGITAILEANRYNEPNYQEPRYTFGEMVIDGSKGTIRLYGDGKITQQTLGQPEKEVVYKPSKVGFCGDSVYAFQQHFVDAMLGNAQLETRLNDYMANLKVEEAMYASAVSGMPVEVEY